MAVLRLRLLIGSDELLHFRNKTELWQEASNKTAEQIIDSKSTSFDGTEDLSESELLKLDSAFAEAEACFCNSVASQNSTSIGNISVGQNNSFEPEALFNMALLKEKRGELRAAVATMQLYVERDSTNYAALQMIKEIRSLVMDDTI